MHHFDRLVAKDALDTSHVLAINSSAGQILGEARVGAIASARVFLLSFLPMLDDFRREKLTRRDVFFLQGPLA